MSRRTTDQLIADKEAEIENLKQRAREDRVRNALRGEGVSNHARADLARMRGHITAATRIGRVAARDGEFPHQATNACITNLIQTIQARMFEIVEREIGEGATHFDNDQARTGS